MEGGRNEWLVFNEHRVSVWENEKALEMDSVMDWMMAVQ